MADENEDYLCVRCGHGFSKKFNCVRHERICSTKDKSKKNQAERTICQKCRKTFASYKSRMFVVDLRNQAGQATMLLVDSINNDTNNVSERTTLSAAIETHGAHTIKPGKMS